MTTCFYGIEGCNCWAGDGARIEREDGYTVVNFEPGLPFSAELLAALLITDEELVELGLLPNAELENALAEVELGNLLTTDEAGILADEVYRLEETEKELVEALAEAESDVDALGAQVAELEETADELAEENILVWLANIELTELLDISTTLSFVGATELARVNRELSLSTLLIQAQQALIEAQAAELRWMRAFSL